MVGLIREHETQDCSGASLGIPVASYATFLLSNGLSWIHHKTGDRAEADGKGIVRGGNDDASVDRNADRSTSSNRGDGIDPVGISSDIVGHSLEDIISGILDGEGGNDLIATILESLLGDTIDPDLLDFILDLILGGGGDTDGLLQIILDLILNSGNI